MDHKLLAPAELVFRKFCAYIKPTLPFAQDHFNVFRASLELTAQILIQNSKLVR